MKRYIRSDSIDISIDDSLTLRELARDPKLRANSLSKLAESDFTEVLKAVSEHPNVTPEILRKLSTHNDPTVDFYVVYNDKTPADVLVKLADKYLASGLNVGDILGLIASHRNTPVDILMKLKDYSDWFVRLGVARNANTPSGVLYDYINNDENSNVRDGAMTTLIARGEFR